VEVRVSTEDQVDYSPEAQARQCKAYAGQHDLGAVTVIRDDGWSGKDLDRAGMAKLLSLVEQGHVAHVVVWRLDGLSRDSGDVGALVKLLERHCVKLHSVNEGGSTSRPLPGACRSACTGSSPSSTGGTSLRTCEWAWNRLLGKADGSTAHRPGTT
jgi:hypothetical protein